MLPLGAVGEGEGQTGSLGVISYRCMQIYNDLEVKKFNFKKKDNTACSVLWLPFLAFASVCWGRRALILFLRPRNHVSSPERVAKDSSKCGKGTYASATCVGRSTEHRRFLSRLLWLQVAEVGNGC